MTSTHDNSALVVGASRGLGRGIAVALAQAGRPVIAVARSEAALAELAADANGVQPEVADAAEASVAEALLRRHDPHLLILVAGAVPTMRPLQEQTWETFSVNWHGDVQIAFRWLQAALRIPMRPGSRVIVVSSGAALQGSPLSGGYAGAKATERFITAYAQDEAERSGLGIRFTTLLPRLTPLTDLGRPAVEAYAARNGQSEAQYLERFGTPLTPEAAGAAVVELLAAEPSELAPDYLLTGAGMKPLG